MQDRKHYTDEQVIESFMEQTEVKGRNIRTDGQSLFSFDTRIAEHVPDGYGRAATLVYDYTYGGDAYISPTTSNHVRLAKKQVPRQNWTSVFDARDAGLVPNTLPEVRHGKTPSNSQ
jgi:hypothetical protein